MEKACQVIGISYMLLGLNTVCDEAWLQRPFSPSVNLSEHMRLLVALMQH